MATPKLIVIFAALSLSLACFSCAGRPSQGVLVPVAEAPVGTSRVRVLVATTRQRSSADDGEMFSGDRGDATSYAAITVSVPPNLAHKVGQIQWPSTVPGDPSRDFVTVSADYIDKPAFLASISAEARQPSHGKVVVFVHGFNTRFDDAVYRFVQIVYDSKSPAVPVLFTWPSRGEMKLRAYNYDRESANYSRDALEELLDNLGRNPGVSEINILAHSMGNWVTLEALRSRYIRPGRATDKIKNVMLVAPDVDIDVFRTQISQDGSQAASVLVVCIARRSGPVPVENHLGWHAAPRRHQSRTRPLSNRISPGSDRGLRLDRVEEEWRRRPWPRFPGHYIRCGNDQGTSARRSRDDGN